MLLNAQPQSQRSASCPVHRGGKIGGEGSGMEMSTVGAITSCFHWIEGNIYRKRYGLKIWFMFQTTNQHPVFTGLKGMPPKLAKLVYSRLKVYEFYDIRTGWWFEPTPLKNHGVRQLG